MKFRIKIFKILFVISLFITGCSGNEDDAGSNYESNDEYDLSYVENPSPEYICAG